MLKVEYQDLKLLTLNEVILVPKYEEASQITEPEKF